MENKHNNATILRPGGDRVLDAPVVEMGLGDLIVQIKGESTWAENDRNSVTIFKSDAMRIVLVGLHENAELKPHKANGVISVQVLEGRIKFLAEQQTFLLEKGQMIALHENITHSISSLTEAFLLLTFAMNK
ncbi:MAG: hypothetical protein JST47_05420 [Bacteroidetes bacterium]|nr:hypothetical protein [Bacteroidota bacterium]MBS1973022.1 hypothetical protein [Bacteroidota bacterium]